MQAVVRSNDPVLLSWVEALLREAGVPHHVADANMSVLEGSIGIFPRRIMVPDDEVERARRLLREAGLGAELAEPRTGGA